MKVLCEYTPGKLNVIREEALYNFVCLEMLFAVMYFKGF